MKFLLFLSMVTILSSSLLAQDSSQQQEQSTVVNRWFGKPGKVYLYGQGTPDGKMYEYYADELEVKKLPEWDPEISDPPLSIPKAATIAIETAKKENPTFESLRVSQVQLMPISSASERKRWFYIVSLYPTTAEEPMYIDLTVVMLMNGTVVKPALEKKERQ